MVFRKGAKSVTRLPIKGIGKRTPIILVKSVLKHIKKESLKIQSIMLTDIASIENNIYPEERTGQLLNMADYTVFFRLQEQEQKRKRLNLI